MAKARWEGWQRVEEKGPFKIAYAKAKPGAVVDAWTDWSKDPAHPS